MTAPGSCEGHGGLPPELRALALLALDRLEPVVERLRDLPASAAPAQGAAVCASCPLCAVLAVLRGERPEMAARLAEHASGLVTLLRTVLLTADGGARAPSAAEASSPASGPPRPRESFVPAGRVDRNVRSSVPGGQDGSADQPPSGTGRIGEGEASGDRPGARPAAMPPRTPDAARPGRGARPVQRIPVTR